jgi:hypothetical protein
MSCIGDSTIKAKHLDLIFAAVVALTVPQFYYTWLDNGGPDYLLNVALSQDGLPFAYRLLIPGLSRMLAWITGFDVVFCMLLLFSISGICLYFSLKFLYTTFKANDKRASIVAFIGCELFCLLILHDPHIYDLSTGAFFALRLHYWHARNLICPICFSLSQRSTVKPHFC